MHPFALQGEKGQVGSELLPVGFSKPKGCKIQKYLVGSCCPQPLCWHAQLVLQLCSHGTSVPPSPAALHKCLCPSGSDP